MGVEQVLDEIDDTEYARMIIEMRQGYIGE